MDWDLPARHPALTIAIVGALLGAAGYMFRTHVLSLLAGLASSASVAALEARLSAVELRLARLPDQEDWERLEGRLSAVERDVAVVRTQSTANGDALRRVEHAVDMLVRHQLNGQA
jgi:hypothetical protein